MDETAARRLMLEIIQDALTDYKDSQARGYIVKSELIKMKPVGQIQKRHFAVATDAHRFLQGIGIVKAFTIIEREQSVEYFKKVNKL